MGDRLNLITDVAGIMVGNAHDPSLASGTTVVLVDRPNVAAASIRGGAPGGRDTALLEPEMTVEGVDAVVLSGGSAFGLDAAGGVMSVLRQRGIGHRIGSIVVPIVSQAIVFDLLNGGDKGWREQPPYWALGRDATRAARPGGFDLGTVGGGYGATTADLKGGLGSASTVTGEGFSVAAIAVVNAVGTAIMSDAGHFWAGPFEEAGEFGALGPPHGYGTDARGLRLKGGAPPSTTIALVATDANLTKAEAKRLAMMADDGLARALRPAHAPMDGDTVFAVATQRRDIAPAQRSATLTRLGTAAADCLARAIARGIYEATALPLPGALPAWRDRYGREGGR
jgi:L-aminopeptidase/D-esterase-like protein